MSYQQAMKWHKKHPKGIRNLYLGFDCSSAPASPRMVTAKLILGDASKTWQPIGEMTVADACRLHPDAVRFASFGLYNEFRCNGPAAIPERL